MASRCCSTVNQKTVVHRENPPILLFHGILLMWKYHPAAALRCIHTDLLGRRNSLQVTVAYFPWSSVVCQSSSDRSLVALTHLSPLCAKNERFACGIFRWTENVVCRRSIGETDFRAKAGASGPKRRVMLMLFGGEIKTTSCYLPKSLAQ